MNYKQNYDIDVPWQAVEQYRHTMAGVVIIDAEEGLMAHSNDHESQIFDLLLKDVAMGLPHLCQ